MSPRESKTIDLALLILRRTFESRFENEGRTLAVQLALRVLLPYVDRVSLLTFWNVMDNRNPLQRMSNLKKVYAGIEAQAIQPRYQRSQASSDTVHTGAPRWR